MNTLLMSAILLCALPAQERYPAKPGPRDFILDEARLLTASDAEEIKKLCDEVLTKKRAPIVVVTIPSLAAYGAGQWPIERYAMNLMAEWGLGSENWNYGMLLLVSPGDRKVRIELGAGWPRSADDDRRRIMRELIIPRFKQGDYSKGIRDGVKGLHDSALGEVPSRATNRAPTSPLPVPSPSQSPGAGCLPVGGIGLIVIVVVGILVVSVISRMLRGGVNSWGNNGPGYYGRGGYYGGYGGGGGFGSSFGGGFLGGALGSILADRWDRRHYSDSSSPSYSPPPSGSDSGSSGGGDSDFGGGSFGGGFSGGGGATGEW